MKVWISLAVGMALLAFAASARDAMQPAELPPASYGGQQYVDSRGCVFLRAGTEADVRWISRVTRDGAPVCGFPPSGNRVAAAGEGASAAEVVPKAVVPKVAAPTVAAGGFLVAVGSFSRIENADRAARSMADLGLPVLRGKFERSGVVLQTVYAGPFATAAGAGAVLARVAAAGFPDAVIVRK